MFSQTRNKAQGSICLTRWLLLAVLSALIAAPSIVAQQDPDDPGLPDWIQPNVTSHSLELDASRPLETMMYVDQPLQGMEIWLEISSVDGGAAAFDSVQFGAPYTCLTEGVLPNRTVEYFGDGIMPDTVHIFMYGLGPDEIWDCTTYDRFNIFYTGLNAGKVQLKVMSGNPDPTYDTKLWLAGNPVSGDDYHSPSEFELWVDVNGGTHIGGGDSQVEDPDGLDVVLINNNGNDQLFEVGLGVSSPIGVTLMWDEVVTGLEYNFEISSVNAGNAIFDSVVFTGHLGDPSILPLRSAQLIGDGVYPDTIQITAEGNAPEEYLEPEGILDIRLLMYLYFTGLTEGDLTLVTLDGGGELENQTKLWSTEADGWFCPVVASESIPVIDGGGLNFNDPGVRDELILHGSAIYSGVSSPIDFRIKNDQEIRYFTGVFEFGSPDGGLVQYDSVVWVGRLRDRFYCGDRRVELLKEQTATEPGKLVVACYTPHLEPYGAPLPAGNEVAFQIYMTALVPGTIEVDTATVFMSIPWRHASTSFETLNDDIYCPAYELFSIAATDGHPPEFVLPDAYLPPVLAGGTVQFEVMAEAYSPGNDVGLELHSLVNWDDDLLEPSTTPTFDESAGWFTWTTSMTEIGVWRAIFRATDIESGAVQIAEIPIQVIGESQYQVGFDLVENLAEGVTYAPPSGVVHGNFDQDADQEVVFSPYYNPELLTSILLYELSYPNQFDLTTAASFGREPFNMGLTPGFFNDDDNLDLTLKTGTELQVLLGNGDNTFTAAPNPAFVPSGTWRGNTVGNFNGDAYLDNIVLGENEVRVYAGTAAGTFGEAAVVSIGPVSEDATLHSLSSADFDGDGWDDLAVSVTDGLWIYLNDQAGGYVLAYTYPMDFPSVDITVTNEGADFNGDGYYDLCITQPLNFYRWDADATRILVYLGNGDGSFSETEVITVEGLSLVNQTGDVNNDGLLDVIFINYDERYLGIVYGDASGSFDNQQRFEVPRVNPFVMDCVDIDVDGDLDVVVEGHGDMGAGGSEQWYYLFVNQADPADMSRTDLQIHLEDNAALELVAPSGGQLSTVTNSIASGEFYRRDIDGDESLDAMATVGAVEPGRYDLVVEAGASGGTFSMKYQLGGQTFSIARDLPVPTDAYVFPIFPDGKSGVTPIQGGCVRSAHPMFEWDPNVLPPISKQSSLPITDIKMEFRAASDPTFDDPFETATITGTRYYLRTELSPSDTSTYFWQLRPEGDTDWGPIFAFNALPVSDQDKDPADRDANTDPDGESEAVDNPVGETIAESTGGVPHTFGLDQNYPNPFNPVTEIAYSIPEAASVRLEVYNVLGRRVTTLVSSFQEPGQYVVSWDASEAASGMYFYRLTADGNVHTRKMILLK